MPNPSLRNFNHFVEIFHFWVHHNPTETGQNQFCSKKPPSMQKRQDSR